MKEKRLTILDFSSLLYSVSYNCSVNKEETDNFAFYRDTLNKYVETIIKETSATHLICFGDGFTSFRKKMFKEFKADRKTHPKLKFIEDITQYATKKWSIIKDNFLEADDMCIISIKGTGEMPNGNIVFPFTEFDNISFKPENIVIATIDSDFNQSFGNYFNWGYRRSKLYKDTWKDNFETDPDKARKHLFHLAFSTINKNEADFNLWKQILIKGHNNKTDYLEGCGDKTAQIYLELTSIVPTRDLVLDAFIYGIKKNDLIKRSVKGYGLMKGIDTFTKAFKQTYLLRTLEEVEELEYKWDIPTPISVILKDEENEEW